MLSNIKETLTNLWEVKSQEEHEQNFWKSDTEKEQEMTCFYAIRCMCCLCLWRSDGYCGAKSPLSSTWKEKSAPRARHKKKPIQNRAVHKSLANVDRADGCWELTSSRADRQADRQHAHPDCLWWKAPLWWGALHTETKACKPWNNALRYLIVTERNNIS